MLKRKRDPGYRSGGALEIEDDELAGVIRASLREYVAGSHPSPRVWAAIKAELARPPRLFHRRVMELFTPAQAALPQLLQGAVTMALLIFIFSVLLERPLNPWWSVRHRGEVSPAAFSAVEDTLSMAYLFRQRGEANANRPRSSIAKRADDPFSSPRFERIRNGIGVLPQERDKFPLLLPGQEEHLHMVHIAQEAYLSQLKEARVMEALATPVSLDRKLNLGRGPDALDNYGVSAIMAFVERTVVLSRKEVR